MEMAPLVKADLDIDAGDSRPPKRARLASVEGLGVECGRACVFEPFSNINATKPTQETASVSVSSPPWREDDEDGHYVIELAENLTPRYKIMSKLGQGTFGQVLECWDREAREYVAVKVTRNRNDFRDSAMIELEMLQLLAKHDKTGSLHCVQLKEWFNYRGHVCIVCERLGPSLHEFVRANSSRPRWLPLDLVRDFGRQLLESVAYMHGLTIMHTDLKPENILLVERPSDDVKKPSQSENERQRILESSQIKVIDLGSARLESHYHSRLVTTRPYRAPEVILELGWSYPCDMWSVGCILAELCMGATLFETDEDLEHLAMMERLLGPIPHSMMMRTPAVEYFMDDADGRPHLNWPHGAASEDSLRAMERLPRVGLRDLVVQDYVDDDPGGAMILTDLLVGLLEFDPLLRLSAKEALNHPFFQEPSEMRELL